MKLVQEQVACYCPNCGYGGKDAAFESIELIIGYAAFTPIPQSDGSIEYKYLDETDVDWDSQQPARNWLPSMRRYRCPSCYHEFSEFAIK